MAAPSDIDAATAQIAAHMNKPALSAADAATVARIAAHMNKDHADSVADYAQFYARLPAAIARTAVISDIALDRLMLRVTNGAATGTVYIPLSPPMASLADSRVRLVAMANEALAGLGRSKHVVRRFVLPGAVHSAVAAAVVFGYWALWNGAALCS